MLDACDRFTLGIDELRELGLGTEPEPWRHCIRCDHPKAQHELPHCTSQAIVKDVLYQCALRRPHGGPHQQDDAEWGVS